MRANQGRDRDAPRCDAARSWRLRLLGWLAAGSLLLNGWLPVLLQASLLASAPGAHADHAGTTDPAAAPAGKSPECPLFHSAICLCATFAKLLPAPRAPVVSSAPVLGARRRRWPRWRPRQQGRQLLFDARAPPASA
jgi:hypothetical protein